VVLIAGGVSKGKFDFLPRVLDELGVKKLFKGVAQRPGGPFWFGLSRGKPRYLRCLETRPPPIFACTVTCCRRWPEWPICLQLRRGSPCSPSPCNGRPS